MPKYVLQLTDWLARSLTHSFPARTVLGEPAEFNPGLNFFVHSSSPCAQWSVSSPGAQWSVSSPCAQWSVSSLCAQWSVSSPDAQWSVSSPCAQWSVSSLCAQWSVSSPDAQWYVSSPGAQWSVSSPGAQWSASSSFPGGVYFKVAYGRLFLFMLRTWPHLFKINLGFL